MLKAKLKTEGPALVGGWERGWRGYDVASNAHGSGPDRVSAWRTRPHSPTPCFHGREMHGFSYYLRLLVSFGTAV